MTQISKNNFTTHPSVRIRGTEANFTPVQCADPSCANEKSHLHCPFCVKAECFQDSAILKAHYHVKHVYKSVEFAGLKILRCCDHCDIVGIIKKEKKFKRGHWHCYKCRNGFIRRNEAMKHYKTHFRKPKTTFQIQIMQEVVPVSHLVATHSIEQDEQDVNPVSHLPVMHTIKQEDPILHIATTYTIKQEEEDPISHIATTHTIKQEDPISHIATTHTIKQEDPISHIATTHTIKQEEDPISHIATTHTIKQEEESPVLHTAATHTVKQEVFPDAIILSSSNSEKHTLLMRTTENHFMNGKSTDGTVHVSTAANETMDTYES